MCGCICVFAYLWGTDAVLLKMPTLQYEWAVTIRHVWLSRPPNLQAHGPPERGWAGGGGVGGG